MKKYLPILGVLFLTLIATPVRSEILRCEVTTKWGDLTSNMKAKLDIVIPNEHDDVYLLGILSKEKKFTGLINSSISRSEIRKGTIEYIETVGGKPFGGFKPSRYDFFVTRMPNEDKGTSLTGFSWVASRIWSIRVDVWKSNKPVYIYRADSNDFATGECR